MKKYIALIIFITILTSCISEKKNKDKEEIKTETFITESFELVKPIKNSKAVLILFGGYGEEPEDKLLTLWVCDKVLNVVENEPFALKGMQKALKTLKV